MVNISLTASMRSNLLSLQSIASQQDLVQNRLATGLKVSSAIDNPSSYYTAQSLNNRASDLTQLLDSMSQGIQTLKAVSETITSVSKFLEQAKAVANQAMENTQPIVARVSSEADLQAALASDKRGLIVIDRDIVMSTNSNIVLKDGQSLVGAKYLDKTARQTSISFNFNNEAKSGIEVGNDSIISDLDLNLVTDKKPFLFNNNAEGVIKIIGNNTIVSNLNITMNTEAAGEISGEYYTGITTTNFGITIKGIVNIEEKVADISNPKSMNTCGLLAWNGLSDPKKLIIASDSILNIKNVGKVSEGINGFDIDVGVNSSLNILTSGKDGSGIVWGSTKLQEGSKINILTKGIGAKGFYSNYINMSSTSSLILSALQDDDFFSMSTSFPTLISAEIGSKIISSNGTFIANTAVDKLSILNGKEIPTSHFNKDDTEKSIDNIEFKKVFDNFDKYMTDSMNKTKEDNKDIVKESYQYNSILNQFDMIIKDSNYKGVNLLLGQSLKVNFNEDRSSKLDITGVNASTNGLGLNDAAWKNQNNVEASISELDSAISDLRQYASEFGNYYSIVSNREEFTNNLVNVLTEGADKLTLADMNQESANMLALQTAQSLAINSLSLASQASQSILKLF